MGTLYKRASSPYYYCCINGQRFSTGTSKKAQAHQVLKRKERELWERRHDLVDNSGRSAEEFFQRYLDWISANKRYHTLRSYRSVITTFKGYFKARGGVRRLKDISSMAFEDYIMHRLKMSKRWTVNNHIIVLKAMFNKAAEWHYIRINPAMKQRKVEVNDSKQIRCLSEEESSRFMKTCAEMYPAYCPMFYAFLTTGMRAGELFNIEWSDVDFVRNLIYIRSKPGFAPKGKNMRSNKAKERMLPLHPGLKNLMQKMPRSQSSYVFTDSGKPFSKHKPRRALLKIAKRAGVEGLTRLHELRHTYASLLLGKGVHIFALKELLGHSDIKDTQKYAHMLPEHLQLTVKLLHQIHLADDIK